MRERQHNSHTRDGIILIKPNIVFAAIFEFFQLRHDKHGSLSALRRSGDRVHLPELGLVLDKGANFQVRSFCFGRVEA